MPEDTQTVTKKQSGLWNIPSDWIGVSGGISDTSNGVLAWGRASTAKVASNRIEWTDKHKIDHAKAVTLEQVHEALVLRVDHALCGSGIVDPLTRIPKTDGMISNDPDVILITSHADCAPIYLYHTGARAIGLIHAGWRGTLSGIASIGPMISTANYEVGNDVAEKFVSKFGPSVIVKFGGKPHLDVFACIIIDLMRAGVATARFCPRPPDTYSDFHWSSFRRDGERAGGMLAYFKLN